jgi:hypothetical protein
MSYWKYLNKMKNGKPQCKDIPEQPILQLLYDNRSKWCSSFGIDIAKERSIYNALPEGTPWSLMLAKTKRMIGKGLIGGCACGCRGDFEITEKGIEELAFMNTVDGCKTQPYFRHVAKINLENE